MAFEKGSTSRLAGIAIGVSLLVGWAISGRFLYRAVIGLDASAFPAGELIQGFFPGAENAVAGMVLGIGTLLLIPIVVFLLVRQRARRAGSAADPGRRSFLAGSAAGVGAGLGALAAGGLGMAGHALFGIGKAGRGWSEIGSKISSDEGVVKTSPTWPSEWRGARVQSHGRLGRTGWPVSDTVLGAGRLRGEDDVRIVREAFERGVNYIDTAPDYSTAGSEQVVGKAMREIPRDQMFLATKFCTPIGHLPAGTSVARYKEVIHESLRRLETDYVDLIHIHSCDELDRLMDPNVHEAFSQLRQEGKARFLGVSTHTPRLVQVASQAIDSGLFDVMMLAYHHGIWPELDDLIARARSEQDMGIVAMKTLKGARHRNLESFHDANSYAQAALKWVHANPDVSCAVISFFEMQHVDEYLHASGRALTAEDVAILEGYDRRIAGTYCAPHCGACLSSCPEDVPIHDVLRHRMYFEDYRSEKQAMELYSKLEVNASACIGCSAPCLGSCPLGIPIPERTREAHELLTFGA
ncbi:MAG TPA: aldo/keto reductase [Myxococcota bacterium]|nr:aldo/keto reductase [Myxococcota bacterium]